MLPMTAYLPVLFLHSWVRWVVLVSAVGALVSLGRGRIAKRPFGATETRAVRIFLSALDTQVLLGLVLYFFLSPFGFPRGRDMAVVMKTAMMRYFAVEHWFGMLVALTVAHLLWIRAKKAPLEKRRSRALWAVGLSLMIIVATHPWPGTPYGRAMFRLP